MLHEQHGQTLRLGLAWKNDVSESLWKWNLFTVKMKAPSKVYIFYIYKAPTNPIVFHVLSLDKRTHLTSRCPAHSAQFSDAAEAPEPAMGNRGIVQNGEPFGGKSFQNFEVQLYNILQPSLVSPNHFKLRAKPGSSNPDWAVHKTGSVTLTRSWLLTLERHSIRTFLLHHFATRFFITHTVRLAVWAWQNSIWKMRKKDTNFVT